MKAWEMKSRYLERKENFKRFQLEIFTTKVSSLVNRIVKNTTGGPLRAGPGPQGSLPKRVPILRPLPPMHLKKLHT